MGLIKVVGVWGRYMYLLLGMVALRKTTAILTDTPIPFTRLRSVRWTGWVSIHITPSYVRHRWLSHTPLARVIISTPQTSEYKNAQIDMVGQAPQHLLQQEFSPLPSVCDPISRGAISNIYVC